MSPDAGVDAGIDAGVDAGSDAGLDAGVGDGGGALCDENTDGFGDACAAMEGDPECGFFLCCEDGIPGCVEGQLLFCYDPGPNDCGGCGDLDQSEGRIGDPCGEFGCGTVICGEDGTATMCEGDHPRNACGGCGELPADIEPGDTCSECMTGTQLCTRDMDDLVCWLGRAPDNQCGTCARCILGWADMDDRFSGGYIKTGTRAIIEDVGGGTLQLVFDPLVEGPGANALPSAIVVLANNEDPSLPEAAPLTVLSPDFANDTDGVGADPVRQFTLPSGLDLLQYSHVVIYENFLLATTVSAGKLQLGVPPDYNGPDAGPPPDAGLVLDAGPIVDAAIVDAANGIDAGAPDASGGGPDAGLDAGVTD